MKQQLKYNVMPYKKGQSGNPNGRPKNSKNKATEDFRAKINEFITENWDHVQKDYDSMDPEKRLTFFERILKYTLPPLQSLSVDANIRNELEKLSDEQLNQVAEKILQLHQN
jgi:transcription termination factor NusB